MLNILKRQLCGGLSLCFRILMMSNEKPAIAPFFPTDHYRLVASNYESFHQARNEALVNALLKYFDDVQPKHVVADIGSGTGFLASGSLKRGT